MSEQLWHDKENAQLYWKYAETHSMYASWAKALLNAVNPKDGDRILDLACGSGSSTRAILEVAPTGVDVIGVDWSQSLIDLAKEHSKEMPLSYFVAAAEEVDSVLNEPVNIVLCSCAFWFFNAPKVLHALSKCTTGDVRIAFNTLCDPIAQRPRIDVDKIPDVMDRARELAVERYSYNVPATTPADAWYSQHVQDYFDWFDDSPFRIVAFKARYDKPSGGGGAQWWDIPVFLCSHLPGLTYEQARDVLNDASEEFRLSRSEPSNELAQDLQFKGWIFCVERFD